MRGTLPAGRQEFRLRRVYNRVVDLKERVRSPACRPASPELKRGEQADTKGVLMKASKPYDSKLIGIISTNLGVLMGSIDGEGKADKRMLALSGRVPVKIDPDSDPIEAGDFLTSSDKPGLAKKATQAGYTVGKALQAWTPSEISNCSNCSNNTIEVFVNLGYSDPDLQLTGLEGLSFIATDSPKLAGSWAPMFTLLRVVTDSVSETIDRIGAFGQLITANLRAGTITADILDIGQIGRIGQIETSMLSPIATDSAGIALRLGDAQTFTITNDQGSPSATFDAIGNATFSGELSAVSLQLSDKLKAESLELKADATISGTLFTNSIVGTFGDLTQRLRLLDDQVTSINATPSAVYVESTTSAALANAVRVENGDLVVNTNLFVLGNTALSSTSITGSLLVDGIIHFTQNMIETIGETLYIQKSKLASVDLLDGTFIVDIYNRIFVTGDLFVSGNTTVGGVLGTNVIRPINGFGDLVFDATGSAKFTGNVQAQGLYVVNDIIASGSGVFRDLAVSASASGTLAIPAGEHVATASGIFINADYFLSVTANWNTTVWTTDKQPDRFTLHFGTPPVSSASADWLVIRRW